MEKFAGKLVVWLSFLPPQMQIKKNEMGLGEEREAKGRMEIAMRQSQGQTYEMEDRIRRSEEGMKVNYIYSALAILGHLIIFKL